MGDSLPDSAGFSPQTVACIPSGIITSKVLKHQNLSCVTARGGVVALQPGVCVTRRRSAREGKREPSWQLPQKAVPGCQGACPCK